MLADNLCYLDIWARTTRNGGKSLDRLIEMDTRVHTLSRIRIKYVHTFVSCSLKVLFIVYNVSANRVDRSASLFLVELPRLATHRTLLRQHLRVQPLDDAVHVKAMRAGAPH